MSRRLRILYVTHVPPSPPRTGAQARMHGLMTTLARGHDLSAISLASPDEAEEAARALREYCREVAVVPAPQPLGAAKRLAQLRSLASARSFEARLHDVAALGPALSRLLGRERFDVVNAESPFLRRAGLRAAPAGQPRPRLVIDEHNVEYDVLRQTAGSESGLLRRAYNAANWRKLRREERGAWLDCDGLTVTSERDAERVRAEVPGARVAVVPNAADVERFRPDPALPAPDGRTVLFFGAIHYFPNTDGILHFLDEAWPILSRTHPRARLQIVGPRPPPAVLARRGPSVEVTGLVDDLRPFLSRASAVIAPLRLGGGTRLKILEAMAMARPVVSTALGAEGLEVRDGAHLLLSDDPAGFAASVGRLLDDPGLGERLGRSARSLVEDRYSWAASARRLEAFLLDVDGAAPR